jgi:hypothetical protein
MGISRNLKQAIIAGVTLDIIELIIVEHKRYHWLCEGSQLTRYPE